jgi:hypothetical protein
MMRVQWREVVVSVSVALLGCPQATPVPIEPGTGGAGTGVSTSKSATASASTGAGGIATTSTSTKATTTSAKATTTTSSGATCPFTGYACGGDSIPGSTNDLYSCSGGVISLSQVCAYGCKQIPNMNDQCICGMAGQTDCCVVDSGPFVCTTDVECCNDDCGSYSPGWCGCVPSTYPCTTDQECCSGSCSGTACD